MFSWGENTPNLTQHPITHLSASNNVVAFTTNDGKTCFLRRQTDRGSKWELTESAKLHIQALSCGDASVLLLSRDDSAFIVNLKDSTVPRPLSLPKRVIQVACGDQHFIALTYDGVVFSWGKNSFGKLGLRNCRPPTKYGTPELVKTLAGIPLAHIAAGGNQSFALSLSGTVFAWGQNSVGQLGLGDTTDRHSPAIVDCLSLKKTVAISCGEKHTAILTKGGLLFTFGSGCYGQLGHNSLRDELRPRLVAELWGAKVTQISCGRNHTLAIVGTSENIYSFGHGTEGQLRNGVTRDQPVPLPVQLSHGANDDTHMWQIVAGGNHSFALRSSIYTGTEEEVRDHFHMVQKIKALDVDTVESWLSKCQNRRSWRQIKKDIKTIFASPSCLNNSFLEKSLDKHFQTSPRYSGLDLSLARRAFEKLATNDKVLSEVVAIVRGSLLPSLRLRMEPTAVEGLRVYLILPELLRVLVNLNRDAELTLDVGAAILSLHPANLQVLESLWSRMPYVFFRSTVKTFCNYLKQTHVQCRENSEPLIKTLRVLQKLYFVNSKSPRLLSAKDFHVNIGYLLKSFQDLHDKEAWYDTWYNFSDDMDHLTKLSEAKLFLRDRLLLLIDYPCILNTDVKCQLWRLLEKVEYPDTFLISKLIVDRTTLLQDTFHYLRDKSCNLQAPVMVKFKEEHGTDYGGVSLEFFHLLAKELLKLQILAVNEYGVAWFTQDHNPTDEFYMLGVLCGMALYNQCLLNIFFPSALFKKLLGLEPSIEDLEEMSPTEAQSLLKLLEYDEQVVEDMQLDFGSCRGQELLPNGSMIPVTKVNRQKYVDLYVDMVFNKSVKRPFEEFEKGFLESCPSNTWKIFLPNELMALVQGEEHISWEDLRENAQYHEYLPTDKIIQDFWEVFNDFSEEQKKCFLEFLTGTDRLPRGRVSRIRMTIKLFPLLNPDEHFPQAETCYQALYLPKYGSVQILRQKLLHAITYCDNFGRH